ncbi:type II secretion system F family protein [Jatrophihabitans sp. DSM 45814]
MSAGPAAPLLLGAGLQLMSGTNAAKARLSWLLVQRVHGAQRQALPARSGLWRRSGLAAWCGLDNPRVLPRATVGAAAAGTAASVGLVPAALVLVVGLVLTQCWFRVRAARRRERRRTELATSIAALREDYASGATPQRAFEAAALAAGHYRPTFEAAAVAAAHGHDARSVFYEYSRGPNSTSADTGLLGLGLASAIAARTGAPLSTALQGVKIDLVVDREVRRAVSGVLAGPRTSATLLALLPIVGLLMGLAMGTRPDRVLLRTPIGLALLTVGALLDLAGLVWTLAMTERATP